MGRSILEGKQQEREPNLSQIFLDVFEKTKMEDFLEFASRRSDVIQERIYTKVEGGCRINISFKVEGFQKGLTQDELDQLPHYNVVDILIYLLDITKNEEIGRILSTRDDVFQTRKCEKVKEGCKITFDFKKK